MAFLVVIKRISATCRCDLSMFRAMRSYLRPPWPVVHSGGSISLPFNKPKSRLDDDIAAQSRLSGTRLISWALRYLRPRQTRSEGRTHADHHRSLLAISNARLGTWLPNPAYLSRLAAEDPPWWLPRLPSIRRLTYLLREVFGQFPADNPLLLVTDGGHYENLGLVELLRQGCRKVYCIDASGDSPPFPETLFQAVALAKEELGVTITIQDYLSLVPGSAEPLKPADPLKKLSARLSKSAVAVGEITYPTPLEAGDPTSCRGTLIFAKALLTPDMPAQLLAYAQAQQIFPRDGTGDQWFSGDQFDAYQELGRYVGASARKASE